MGMSTAAYWMLIVVSITSVIGKPASMMRTQKRQSDQRVAELETLLALQKYGAHHFLRTQASDGSYIPAFGIIDFNKIFSVLWFCAWSKTLGRKKKSSQTQDFHDWVLSSWLASNPSSDTRLRNRNWKGSSELDPVTSNTVIDEED